jgi:hypothetical protein
LEWPKQISDTGDNNCFNLLGKYIDRGEVSPSSILPFASLPAFVSSGDVGLSESRKGYDGRSGGTNREFIIERGNSGFLLKTVDDVSGAVIQQQELPSAACHQGTIKFRRSSAPVPEDGIYAANVQSDLTLHAASDGSVVVFERYVVEQRDFLVIKQKWKAELWYRFASWPRWSSQDSVKPSVLSY